MVRNFVTFMALCIASVPMGFLLASRNPLKRNAATAQDEKFWIVPKIEFGPCDPTRPA